MQRNIVLVVHGVGEQKPGETLDSLVGAASHILKLGGRVGGHTELLVDGMKSDRQMHTFPCAIRRTALDRGSRIGEHRQPQRQMVLAAEVYWADLSAAPEGRLAVLKDLLHTVLALGYLAQDNVKFTNSPAPTRWLVAMFTWVFHGIIAPCNALMLLGAMVLLATDLILRGNVMALQCAIALSLCLWAVAMIGAAFFARRAASRRRSVMAVRFWRGGMVISTAMLLWSAFLALNLPDGDRAFSDYFKNVADGLVGVMVMGWGLSLVLLTMMVADAALRWLAGLLIRRDPPAAAIAGWRLGLTDWLRDKQTIYIPTCSAMLILWTLLSASFWAVFSASAVKILGSTGIEGLFRTVYDTNVPRATATLSAVMIGSALMVAAGLIVALLRYLLRDGLGQDPRGTRADIWLGRVIVNPIIATLLFLLVFALGWESIRALLQILSETTPGNSRGGLALVLAGTLGALILWLQTRLAAGLGVVRDVTSYSIRAWGVPDNDPAAYPVRHNMLGRFDLVLDHAMALMPKADRLIVIAHSQGTVIAATALARWSDRSAKKQLTDKQQLPAEVHLVTMGSPVGHIYQQYFPLGFPLTELPGQLTSWLNIYRGDDFVGTSIDGAIKGVCNLPVGSGGHLNYWTDHQVWSRALAQIGAPRP